MARVPLGNGRFATIDDEDLEKVSSLRWYLGVGRYAMNVQRENRKTKATYMHRLITGAKKGEDVDHINMDGLDNRKNNLRLCSRSQNLMNRSVGKKTSSGLKGVSWSNHSKKWRADISVNGKVVNLGFFADKYEAKKAYDSIAMDMHGEFFRP